MCCDADDWVKGRSPTKVEEQTLKPTFRYKSWSEAIGKAAASVAVLYSGDYGFSDRLSQTLARGITKANVATEMVDLLSVDPQVLPYVPVLF